MKLLLSWYNMACSLKPMCASFIYCHLTNNNVTQNECGGALLKFFMHEILYIYYISTYEHDENDYSGVNKSIYCSPLEQTPTLDFKNTFVLNDLYFQMLIN